MGYGAPSPTPRNFTNGLRGRDSGFWGGACRRHPARGEPARVRAATTPPAPKPPSTAGPRATGAKLPPPLPLTISCLCDALLLTTRPLDSPTKRPDRRPDPYCSKLLHDHPKPCKTTPRPPIARARPDPHCSKLLHDHPKPCKTSPRPPIARARPDPYGPDLLRPAAKALQNHHF